MRSNELWLSIIARLINIVISFESINCNHSAITISWGTYKCTFDYFDHCNVNRRNRVESFCTHWYFIEINKRLGITDKRNWRSIFLMIDLQTSHSALEPI